MLNSLFDILDLDGSLAFVKFDIKDGEHFFKFKYKILS